MTDQLVAEVLPTQHTQKNTRRMFMPSAGFELAILATKRLQTYALDLMATGITFQVMVLATDID
jgi:hypothetical protein